MSMSLSLSDANERKKRVSWQSDFYPQEVCFVDVNTRAGVLSIEVKPWVISIRLNKTESSNKRGFSSRHDFP